jgi:hypothetical protein
MEYSLAGLLLAGLVVMLAAGIMGAPAERGRLPLLTIKNLVLSTFLVYLPLPALMALIFNGGQLYWAGGYGTADVILKASVICVAGAGTYLILYGLWPSRRSALASREAPYRFPTLVVYAIIIAGVALKLFLLSRIGSITQIMTRMSPSHFFEITAQTQFQELQKLIPYSESADLAATVLLAEQLRRKRPFIVPLVLMLGCFSLTYLLSAKRSELLVPIFILILAFHYYIKRISVKFLPAFLVIGLGFGMVTLMARIYLPNIALGNAVDLRAVNYAGGSILKFYLFSPEFSAFDMVVRAAADPSHISDQLGGLWPSFYRSNIEPFSYVIPRSFWPNKPLFYADLSQALYTTAFGGGLSARAVGIASTLIGHAFVWGNFVGVIVAFGVFGALSKRVDASFLRERIPRPGVLCGQAVALVLFFHMFRQGSLGPVFMIFLQNLAVPLVTGLAIEIAGRALATTPVRGSVRTAAAFDQLAPDPR